MSSYRDITDVIRLLLSALEYDGLMHEAIANTCSLTLISRNTVSMTRILIVHLVEEESNHDTKAHPLHVYSDQWYNLSACTSLDCLLEGNCTL